ncbi:MAG: DUF1987 domain-containing protein, partial [Flavobacteriales bacterium]|nr:DUF1987 domain-containing protein [Flavobacteriales bacterium]
MNKLSIESTESSPKVLLDPESFYFEISGESRPEDVRKFYEPVLSWMDDFNGYLGQVTAGGQKAVVFNFIFEYFNSSSAKYIMDI